METLRQLGFHLDHTISGLLGGAVAALSVREVSPWTVFISVFVGGACSNYMTAHAAKFLGLNEGFAGFVVGITALIIVQAITEYAKGWRPSIWKSGHE